MKKQARTKKLNLRLAASDRLRLWLRVSREKLAAKGKSFELFPNEAPH